MYKLGFATGGGEKEQIKFQRECIRDAVERERANKFQRDCIKGGFGRGAGEGTLPKF